MKSLAPSSYLRFMSLCIAGFLTTGSLAQDYGFGSLPVDFVGQNTQTIFNNVNNGIATSPPRSGNRNTSQDSLLPTSEKSQVTLMYGNSAPLSRTVQSEFLARVRQGNPAAAQQVAAQFAQYNPSEIFARFAKAAGVPFRDPSSSMAIYTVIGWGIANNDYPDPNNATDMARVRAVRSQMIPLIGSLPNMAKPEMRQRLDEELMILSVLLDAANTSATTREGPDARAKLSDGVHAMWLKQFGKDLRKLALTDQGLIKK